MEWSRVYIMGNSGSGKTWLAKELSYRLGWRAHHLDMLRWKQEAPGEARDNLQVAIEVNVLALEPSWIMEGVYGWLAQVAQPRVSSLIWTDLPVSECVANVRARGPQGCEDAEGFRKTIAWTEQYPFRQNSSCLAAHQKLFSEFRGKGIRLTSRADMSNLLGSFEPRHRDGLADHSPQK